MKKLRLYLNKNLDSGLKNINNTVGQKSKAKQNATNSEQPNDNFWG